MAIEVRVTNDGGEAKLEEGVNEEIARFQEWFTREMANAPLEPVEIAILKTYLWYAQAETKKRGQ